MKKNILIALFVTVASLCCSDAAWGQFMPERKMVREGVKHYGRGEYAESEVDYRRALDKDSSLYEARYNLAASIYKQGRFEEASKLYSSLAMDSLRGDMAAANYYNNGNALFGQDNLQGALEAYKEAMRRDPSDMDAKFNYAYVKKLLESQQNDQNGQNDQQQNNSGDGQDDQNNDRKDPGREPEGDQQDNRERDQNKDEDGNGDNDDQNPDKKGDDRKDDGGSNEDDENNDDNPQDKGDRKDDGNDQRDKNAGGNNNDNRNSDADPRQSQGGMSRDDAQKILDVMQQKEDKTREKVGEKREGTAVGRSGKNW